jgi:hypothetical protein
LRPLLRAFVAIHDVPISPPQSTNHKAIKEISPQPRTLALREALPQGKFAPEFAKGLNGVPTLMGNNIAASDTRQAFVI